MTELDYTNINEWADFWYHTVGVNVIHIISKNKGDPSKGFGKVSYTQYKHNGKQYNLLNEELPEEIFKNWTDNNIFSDGIAIVGGLVYRGENKGKYLIMIDFDNQKAIDEFYPNNSFESAKNKTLVEQHRDRLDKAHVYYYYKQPVSKKDNSGVDEAHRNDNTIPLIEVKGQGSHGIHVVTPSIHSNGQRYEIVSNTVTPSEYIEDIEIYIDRIVSKYNIGYLSNQMAGNGLTPINKFLEKNFKVPAGGGRRPTILRVIENYLRENQSRLDDPQLKDEAIKYATKYDSDHFDESLGMERIVYQVDCAWNYIHKLRNNGQLYPLSQNKTKIQKQSIIDSTAEKIMSIHRFITLRDTDEILTYDEDTGIFKNNFAESLIRELTEREIQNCDSSARDEVIDKIKAQTYVSRKELDKDSYMIAVKNGMLDIKNLELHPHDPKYLATSRIPVNFSEPNEFYDPNTETNYETIKKYIGNTEFFKYLEKCFTINNELRENDIFTILEAFASILIKNAIFAKAIMFIGRGENGKSVMLYYIERFIGEDNISNIALQDIAEDKFATADLYGKLANVFADIESDELRKTGKLKNLISGDRMSAQRKHQHRFDFYNYAKMIFSANKFPKVYDQSDGFFRRFIISKWEKRFGIGDRDSNLKYKLVSNEEEKSMVLTLLIIFARRMMVRGRFKHEPNVGEVRKEWNRLADPITMFIEYEPKIIEETGNEDDKISKKDMWTEFKNFAFDNQIKHNMTIAEFGKQMSNYFETNTVRMADPNGVKTRPEKAWIGVKLVKRDKPEDEKQSTLD